MKNKPIIGVLPQYNAIEKRIYIAPPYMNGILEGGGLPVLLPFVKNKKDIKILELRFNGILNSCKKLIVTRTNYLPPLSMRQIALAKNRGSISHGNAFKNKELVKK